MPEIVKRLSEIDECNLSIDIMIDIERGCWQAKHGFTVTSKQMKRHMKRTLKGLEKYKRK